MDALTMAIIASVAAGLTGGLTDVGKKVAVDIYEVLKEKIKNKYDELYLAVNELEKKPNSPGRRDIVIEEVENSKASKDTELSTLAQKLLKEIESTPEGEKHIQVAKGSYIAQADRGGKASVKVKQK